MNRSSPHVCWLFVESVHQKPHHRTPLLLGTRSWAFLRVEKEQNLYYIATTSTSCVYKLQTSSTRQSSKQLRRHLIRSQRKSWAQTAAAETRETTKCNEKSIWTNANNPRTTNYFCSARAAAGRAPFSNNCAKSTAMASNSRTLNRRDRMCMTASLTK